MKRFVLLVGFISLLSAGLFAQQKDRIAVFPFEEVDKVLSQTEALFFYREFSNEFTNKNAGRITIVPRQDVEKLINTEKAFQLTDLSSKAKTAEYESVLNGTQILSGIIGKVGNSIRVTVSLYTYPDLAQLPGGTTLSVANTTELFNKIPELVQNMQNAISGKNENKIYKVGDIGPAGGFVFYDKGVFSDGWRYLEAAPNGIEFNAQWGTFKKDIIGTGISVGSGKRNTQLITERLNSIGENNRAAQICASIEINGFKDWFLPSKDELGLMYENLKVNGLDNFKEVTYWSSSQYSNNEAWFQYFTHGYQYMIEKNKIASVRAIRAF